MTTKLPDEIDRHVGARVRMRRMMMGMTQTQVGDAVGVTFQQIQKNENGTNRIAASRLQQIADLFQVPVSFFFEGAPSKGFSLKDATPDFASEFLATPDGLALAKAFHGIASLSLRRKIVALVEGIAKP